MAGRVFEGDKALEEMEGTVENIIFASTDGRFTVFKLRPERQHSLVNVTANAPAPLIGQQLVLQGEWIVHAKFGDQFKAQSILTAAPTSLPGIERFLASGVIDGVGPAMAKRLIKEFGSDTLDIIARHPGRLKQVEGIGEKKAKKIYESYQAQSELQEIMLWLETHGISGTYAAKIFAKYSSASLEVLNEDPYRLAREVEGIGFTTADQIAGKIGVDRAADSRIAAGIDYALLQISLAGHCCVPEEILLERTARLLFVNPAEVAAVLKKQLQQQRLCTENVGAKLLIYPPYLYQAEKQTAERLLDLQKHIEPLAVEDAALLAADWERAAGISLADQQRDAIEAALQYGILVLTGGPGTGKTTVVRGIIAVLEEQGLQIRLGAPTGRAAKRLSEATGRKAITVHRLLEATGGRSEGDHLFARDSDEPLEADVIILDEVSMMDIVLMQHFLNAVPDGCRVILVGDVDQLPAVGPGAVLKDILRAAVVPSIRLTEVFRQSGESTIVMNAHAINAGRLPAYRSQTDFQLREIAESGAVAREIVALCTSELPAGGFSVLDDVQVLSPMHRLDCGVENLNKLLQAALNPSAEGKAEWSSNAQVFRLGDKVMQTRNNYTKNVFNGDIGFIAEIEETKLIVRYAEERVAYEKNELSELQLAYAMSVHKSQGSEYPVVILPLIPGHHIMLQRNLLYTAVTRARQRVILLGTKAALHTAIANDRTKKRYTLLAERLTHTLGE